MSVGEGEREGVRERVRERVIKKNGEGRVRGEKEGGRG